MLYLLLMCQISLEPLTAKLGSIEYLTGSFVQTDYWALTLDSEQSSGTLHLAHPNLFLLEYDDTEGRATGSTGEQVYTVDPDFQEILLYTGSPTGFLHILTSGEQNPGDNSIISENGDSVTVTLSGEFDGGITSITAGYTLADSLPFLLSTVDANGNSTCWELSDLTRSDSSPDVFAVPEIPGYALVDAGTI